MPRPRSCSRRLVENSEGDRQFPSLPPRIRDIDRKDKCSAKLPEGVMHSTFARGKRRQRRKCMLTIRTNDLGQVRWLKKSCISHLHSDLVSPIGSQRLISLSKVGSVLFCTVQKFSDIILYSLFPSFSLSPSLALRLLLFSPSFSLPPPLLFSGQKNQIPLLFALFSFRLLCNF